MSQESDVTVSQEADRGKSPAADRRMSQGADRRMSQAADMTISQGADVRIPQAVDIQAPTRTTKKKGLKPGTLHLENVVPLIDCWAVMDTPLDFSFMKLTTPAG